MEVIVKNCQLSKTHISKMTYNHPNNILACNIDGNDTILFFTLDSQSMNFVQIFKGMSKPPGSKISMTWSPDGKYLALAAGNVQIWQLKDGRLKPMKAFQQDFIQIKLIEWSVDSQSYVCGGVSRTNTVKIRNIQTGKVKQLQLPQKQTISAISFDPYGKYLFLLLRNNTIEIYSILNYQKYKSIKLSPQGLKINPIKQVRIPAWSPDFSNFVCPSLDDSRINLAINLSRTKDFKTKNIFMGHCTSISCCKFNPKLYKWNGEITSIVAMGDSAGNVSFWRIGTKSDFPEPLLLSNSLQNSMQVVEDLDWNEKGDILLVNMMKKYVHLIKFMAKQKSFGIQLTNDQMYTLIRETYGSNRATDVNNRQIQVFDFNSSNWGQIQQQKKVNTPCKIIQQKNTVNNQINNISSNLSNQINPSIGLNNNQHKMDIQEDKIKQIKHNLEIPQNIYSQPPLNINPLMMAPVIVGDSKNEYVKLSEQKVIIGKNNKKKIQPAMMVRKQQLSTLTLKPQTLLPYHMNGQNFSNSMFYTNSMVQTFPSLQLPIISFAQKQINISRNRILQIKRLSKVTSLEIVDLLQSDDYLVRRIFPSNVDYVNVSQKFIYVINQQFLYVFDCQFNAKQLPLKVGFVHKFITDQQGVVYFINCDGYLIGFDHVKNINKTLTPVPLHLLLKENFQSQGNSSSGLLIKQFTLTANGDVLIVIQVQKGNGKKKRERYLYDTKKNGWVRLQYKQGILQSGFSIRISDNQQNIVKNYFLSLCPSLKQKLISTQNKQKAISQSGVISSKQQQMIYYQKYKKDKSKYYESLVQYLNYLKNQKRNKQLRYQINQYFFNNTSNSFIVNQLERNNLWNKVLKQIGGSVVQEFIININKSSKIDIQ